MEAVHGHRLRVLPEKPPQPRPQFLRRLAREGDGEARSGRHVALQHQMRDAMGEHARLARAGSGDHHQRAVDGLRCARLIGVEPGEDTAST